MTQFNLFFRILELITQLLEVGADASTTHEARRILDALVDGFKKSQDMMVEEDECEVKGDLGKDSPLKSILDKIATKERAMSQELKEYFQVIDSFQLLNNLLFRGLPSLEEADTPELAKLRVEIFAILNDLLKVGLTSGNLHEAHTQLDAILEEHEQVQASNEKDALDHLFPNLENNLNSLTIILNIGGKADGSF